MSYYLQTLPLLLDIYQKMNFWLSVTILIPGFVLNLMMAGIFTQKKFWTTTMGYYFTLYPLLGNLAVAIGAVNFLAYSLGVDLTLSNYASCYIIWVCRLLFITGIQYFQVQVTLDRAVNVVYPRRFLWLTKTRNLSIITGLIYLILFVYSASSQSFRSIAYTTQTRNNVTVVLPTTCNYYSTPLIVNNILFCVIRTVGFVVCFLANLIIVKKLIDSKKSLHGSASRMSRKQFYFASALMASNFIKVLFILPSIVVVLVQLGYSFTPNTPADKTYFWAYMYAITSWGNYLFEAIHFWVMLATNKLFRAELARMLCAYQLRGGSSVRMDSSRTK